MVPFDTELIFASNPIGFRNNPTNIANPDTEYLEIYPKNQYFEGKGYFWLVIPFKAGTTRFRMKNYT